MVQRLGHRRSRPRGPGLTLIEALAVLVILGVLATLTVPRLAGSGLSASQGRAAAGKLAATLRRARRLAIDHAASNGAGYRVTMTRTGYETVCMGPPTTVAEEALPSGWTFEQASGSVTFGPFGGATAAGGQTPTYAVTDGDERWVVRVNEATGYVWIEEG